MLKNNAKDKQGFKKRSLYSFEDRGAFPFIYVMVGIPFVFFCFFWVYINASSIGLAFVDSYGKVSFDNFKMIFTAIADKDMYGWNLGEIIGRTALLWFLVDICCVVPSMFSSYILYKKIFGAFVFRVIFMIPTVLGSMTWIMIMKAMVGVDGPVLAFCETAGISVPTEVTWNGFLGSSETAFNTIIVLNVLPKIVGFNLLVTGAYARIPNELFEVGRLEGHGFIPEFFTVAVPLIWPTVVISMITNLAAMFTFEGGVFLYTMGASDTATVGFYIYNMTYSIAGSADVMEPFYGYAAAIGVFITCITIPMVLFGKFVLEKAIEPVEY